MEKRNRIQNSFFGSLEILKAEKEIYVCDKNKKDIIYGHGSHIAQHSPSYVVQIQPSKAVHTIVALLARLKLTNAPANLILFTCRVINI